MTPNIPEYLERCTVRIKAVTAKGISTGTGFFYRIRRGENEGQVVLVTNKHVIDGAQEIHIPLTTISTSGHTNVELCRVQCVPSTWVCHNDPQVDLAMMLFDDIARSFCERNARLHIRWLDSDLIPTKEEVSDMIGLESICMVGYPNGLWDNVNNLPIFRWGALASNYWNNWQGRKEFLIDAACFPGSSGSPVFHYSAGGYVTRSRRVVGPSRIQWLGILYAGPQHTVEGKIEISPIVQHNSMIYRAAVPNNLGVVIKSEQVQALELLTR